MTVQSKKKNMLENMVPSREKLVFNSEVQFSFCFHWSPSSSIFWLFLLETQVTVERSRIHGEMELETLQNSARVSGGVGTGATYYMHTPTDLLAPASGK